VALGEVVLPAGQYLGPAEVGILATAGAATVQVRAQQP
jgi:molybdopterin biosynthesis enzyme